MAYQERKALYDKLSNKRNSTVMAYVNNIGLPVSPMCVISARYIHKILQSLDDKKEKLDFIVITNGGDTTAPVRIISLLRHYFREINIVLPYRCYSAGTALALGGDNIIMGPISNLGPIDPSVNNPHNIDGNGRPLPAISVEAVKAYFNFIKEDLGIKDEGNVAEALNKLTNRTPPIALGCVKQGISLAKLVATNLLSDSDKYTDEEKKKIINILSTDFHAHSYPITRNEAEKRVGLKIVKFEALNDGDFHFDKILEEIYEDFAKELVWDEEWLPARHRTKITSALGFNPQKDLPHDTDLFQTIIESHSDNRYVKKEVLRIGGLQTPQGMVYNLSSPSVRWEKCI